ncbi:MAG: nuclear transport factor 2 family protein [Verrucomicrobiota bacterium]
MNLHLLRSIFPTLGLGLILATPASAEISQTAATTCVQQWAALVAQGQADELGKLLHDSYQHIHGTGLVESKTAFLEALRNGTRKYEPIQLENLKFRSFQDTAILTAQFNLKATARGKKIEGLYLASFTLIQTAQGLFIVSFQATPLKPATP